MILDTSAVSAILAGDHALGRVLEPDDHHHLPLLVIGEYLFGLLSSRKRSKLMALFRKLEAESTLLLPDRGTADWYASIRNDLKKEDAPFPKTTSGSPLWPANMLCPLPARTRTSMR